MLRLRRLFYIVLLCATSAVAQSFPETDALAELFLAKDLDSALRHLPPEWKEYISDLDDHERRAITPVMLFATAGGLSGTRYTRPQEGDALLVQQIEIQGQKTFRIEVVLDKRISNGYESMLRFKLHNSEARDQDEPTFQVLMRFEEAEWRLYEIQQPYSREKIDINTPDLLERSRNSSLGDNECAAIATLASLWFEYQSKHKAAGDPPPVSDSSQEDPEQQLNEEPSQDGQQPPDAVELRPEPEIDITQGPVEKNGYRFTYEPGFSMNGEEQAFEIIARPLEFGRTGSMNFFIDQTHIVRYTRQNREATAEDRQFQTNRFYVE